MKTVVDWLSKNHQSLHRKATQIRNYLMNPANRERMGFAPITPQGRWFDMKFVPKLQAFDTALNAWKNPATRTPMKTATLNNAEAAFLVVFRKLYRRLLKNNPLVTVDDLKGMGLPERHSGSSTPAPVAADAPDANIDTSVIRRLGIGFFEKGSSHRNAKPAGQHGAEIRWVISDTPIVDVAGLLYSLFNTHTPFSLGFLGSQRGKTVYFALCWENTRGQKGPWSEIQSAIIP
jgi:hypothetical protein